MSLEKIQQLVGSLARTVEDNEKIAVPVLAVKLAKCLEAYPEDQTIGAMNRVIDKMADNDNVFIRRAELKQLYNKLYSRNTKFAHLFAEELGITPTVQAPKPLAGRKDPEVNKSINTYSSADPILANALNSVFDKNVPLKLYSQSLADNAKFAVNSTLDSWNLKPTSVNVDDGNEKFLVVKANYDTPKGITSFYVPVEISNNKVSEASVFMGNAGPEELNNANVKSYITRFAGSKLKVNGQIILNALVTATSENREVSGAELALTRLNASRQTKSDFFDNQIIGQKVAEAGRADVSLPKSDEFKSFEDKFSSPYGQASFDLGEDKVKLARETIARELLGLGHKNPQITVTGHDKNTIFYGVSLDAGKVAFTVPVKIASGKLQKPSVLVCNGSISSFDRQGITELYLNNQTDYKVAAVASPQFGLKPSELINNVREAVAQGNTSKAEDALNILANSGDAKAYATAFNLFVTGLGKVAKASDTEHKCSLMVKNASSQSMICGHTGLPLHKVYQDKHGNCRPLYRRDMEETYEGAMFMNAKIFG